MWDALSWRPLKFAMRLPGALWLVISDYTGQPYVVRWQDLKLHCQVAFRAWLFIC